jgi:hypothetical protein
MAILRRFEVTPCTATVAAHGIFVFVHDDHIADDNFRRKLLYILRPLGRQGRLGTVPAKFFNNDFNEISNRGFPART